MQLVVIALGLAAGVAFCRKVQPMVADELKLRYGATVGVLCLVVFSALLIGLPPLAYHVGGLLAVAEGFYRSGALVFGGGHVVLPLLRETVVATGWISSDDFLAGYGAAQAIPGPMFTLSAYLGARMPGNMGGPLGAAVALIAIFLPGFLLLAGMLPLWSRLVTHKLASYAIAGVNAAVVGILAAALYDPVWTNAVQSPTDLAIAIVGFTLLVAWRISAVWVVVWCIGAALVSALV